MANGTSSVVLGSGLFMGMQSDHVDSMAQSLLSVSEFAKHGYISIFDNDHAYVIYSDDNIKQIVTNLISVAKARDLVQLTGFNCHGLYRTVLALTSDSDTSTTITTSNRKACAIFYATVQTDTKFELVRYWHEALGHPSMTKMIEIVRNKTFDNLPVELSITSIRKYFPACIACPAGNLARKPLPNSLSTSSDVTEIGAVVQLDCKGPMTDDTGKIFPTLSGHKYVFSAVDKASDMNHVFLIRTCKSLEKHIKKIITLYKHAEYPIKKFQVDSTFNTGPIRELLATHGIILQVSAPYEHG
jgi:hypothetical protein